MKGKMLNYIIPVLVFCMLFVLSGCAQPDKSPRNDADQAGQVEGQKVQSEKKANPGAHLEGEVISIVVPFSPGGGADQYARIFQKYASEYFEENVTVIVENVEGAGGLIGCNQIYKAKPDGITLGYLQATGSAMAELMGVDGIQYEMENYTYLARAAYDPFYITVLSKSGYNDIHELLAADKTLKIGADGPTGPCYLPTRMLTDKIWDETNWDWVLGFDGMSELHLSQMQGDIDVINASEGFIGQHLNAGTNRALLAIAEGRSKVFPDVPTIYEEFEFTAEEKKIVDAVVGIYTINRVVVAPPGMDEDLKIYLQDVFGKIINDERVIEEIKAIGRTHEYLPGDELQMLVKNTMNTSEELIGDLLKEVGQ